MKGGEELNGKRLARWKEMEALCEKRGGWTEMSGGESGQKQRGAMVFRWVKFYSFVFVKWVQVPGSRMPGTGRIFSKGLFVSRVRYLKDL